MDIKEFLFEEYKANWEYIKHTEEVRVKLYQLYIAITAAMLSVLAALYKFSNGDADLIHQGTMYISFFLSIYGFLFVWLMFNQKKGYEKYRLINNEIRDFLYSNCSTKLPKKLLEAYKSVDPKKGKFMKSTFVAWLSLPFSISLASSVMFIIGLCS
jgi:hypothetical protein